MVKQLSQEARDTLTRYKSSLQKNDLINMLDRIGQGPIRTEIVEFLIEAGLDPLKYLTKIPDSMMRNGTEVESLTIPGSIEVIGEDAFKNSALKSVTFIGGDVIGKRAFQECKDLTQISLGEVNAIRDHAFAGTGLKDVILPETVTMLGRGVFPDDCVIRSPHRKRGSLKFPKSEYDWYKKHLVLDESLEQLVGDVE